MTQIIATAIVIGVITFFGYVPLAVFCLYWRWLRKKRRKFNPLRDNLLRSPGHSLRNRIEELTDEFSIYLVLLSIMPLFCFTLTMLRATTNKGIISLYELLFYVVVLVIGLVFVCYKIMRIADERYSYYLGLDGEMATAEELNKLMLDGYHVYHDVPTEKYGNIDHAIVGPSGFYCIETKLRQKPEGKKSVTVDYKKGVIQFPDFTMPIHSDQVETQRRWLTERVSNEMGEKVVVKPMVSLPGWNVDRIGKGSVSVFSPKNPQPMFVGKPTVLNEKLVKQIAFQLDKLCRTVEVTNKKQE